MALKARKSAVENSNLEAVIDSQEPLYLDGNDVGNFPTSQDTDVALGKPQSLEVLLGVDPKAAWPNVTLVGKDKEKESQGGKIDDLSVAVDAPHLLDCQTLTRMELRKKYPGEATSHRHMLERAASHGRTIHPQFREFREFLAAVGPQPFPKATLDRRINDDPEYAPGKVRWADKRTQSNNRHNTLLFQSSDGRHFLSSELAKLHGVKPSTIRQRRQRGWSDEAIIAGKQLPPPSLTPVGEPIKATAPDVLHIPHLEVAWLQAMHAVFPGECSVLTAAEKGMLKTFAKFCSEACLTDQAVEVLDHTIRNWIDYAKTAENDHSSFNIPMRPTIGFLIKYPRPALNLWLRANDLEMKDGFPQLKAPSPKAPLLSEPVKKLSVPEMWPSAPPPPPHRKMSWEEIMADPDDNDL
jgi:hypothetical protein